MRILNVIIISFIILTLSCCSHAQKQSFESLSNEQFNAFISKDSVIIIDVRTPKEFSEGHIPNAINIDVNSISFEDSIKKIPQNYKLAIYCRSGKRSKTAINSIYKWGYQGVELNNGYINWNNKIDE